MDKRGGADAGLGSKIRALTRLGTDGCAASDTPRVILVNVLALGAIVMLAAWIVVQLILNVILPLVVSVVTIACFAVVLLLQHRQQHERAAVVMVLTALLTINAQIYLANSANGVQLVQLYLLIVIWVPFLAFPLRYRWTALGFSLLAYLNYTIWCLLLEPGWQHAFATNDPSAVIVRDVSVVGLLAVVGMQVRRIKQAAVHRLEDEKRRADQLISDILPEDIASALKRGERGVSRHRGDVSVVYVEVDKFSELCARLWPGMLATQLNDVFSRFDAICEAHGVERIKSTREVYIAAAGLSEESSDHAERAAAAALAMHEAVELSNKRHGGQLRVRIGIDSGPVVSGVVGSYALSYDLWGFAVNRARELVAEGRPGMVHVSSITHAKIRHRYQCVPRGWGDEGRSYWLGGVRSPGVRTGSFMPVRESP